MLGSNKYLLTWITSIVILGLVFVLGRATLFSKVNNPYLVTFLIKTFLFQWYGLVWLQQRIPKRHMFKRDELTFST